MKIKLHVAALLLAAGSAFAAQNDVAAIVTQQTQMRTEVQAGKGRYKDMPEQTRNALIDRQSDILGLLQGKQSIEELSPDERTRLSNDLEWVASVVNNAEDERMICEYEKTIGSNRKTRICKTVAQKRKEQEAARNIMLRGTRCQDLSCTSIPQEPGIR